MANKDELLTTVCTSVVMIKAIKILVEIIDWLAIAGGTTLGAGIISFIAYSKWENETIAFAILIVGFIIGATWTTKISMKYGTIGMAFRSSKNILIKLIFSQLPSMLFYQC